MAPLIKSIIFFIKPAPKSTACPAAAAVPGGITPITSESSKPFIGFLSIIKVLNLVLTSLMLFGSLIFTPFFFNFLRINGINKRNARRPLSSFLRACLASFFSALAFFLAALFLGLPIPFISSANLSCKT